MCSPWPKYYFEHTIVEHMNKRLTTEEFIEKARKIHGDKYDYSKVEYKSATEKVIIICPIHGEFLQAPTNHIRKKNGCPKCQADKCRSTKEQFIEKAKSVHGDKYDYSKVNYINSHTNIAITCPIHGDFEQTPKSHLLGCGCKKCSGKEQHTTEEFIQLSNKVHNNKYDYSKSNYISGRTRVLIGCPIHGMFQQLAYSHLQGEGCQKCARELTRMKQLKTTDTFIKEAIAVHGDTYDYSLVNYTGKDVPVEIVCRQHGIFKQRPHSHLNGAGCPKCLLKSQRKIFDRLQAKFPEEEILFEVGNQLLPWLKRQRLDIYFPKYNIAVEYDGKQHFEKVPRFEKGKEGLKLTQLRDRHKNKICAVNKCHLFRIKYNYSEEDFIELVTNINNIIYDCQ